MSFDRVGPGWRDLVIEMQTRGTGVNDPAWTAWRGNMFAFEFVGAVTMKQVWGGFHLDHDYMPNSEIYLHIHYLNAAAGNGTTDAVRWQFEITYAKRDSAAFPATSTVGVTQLISTTQYRHQVAEVATGLTVANFETDGIILCRAFRDPTDPADTYTGSLWGIKLDAHYQTDHYTTPNKASPFF